MTLTPIVITINATHSHAIVLIIPVEKKNKKQKANAYNPIWAVSKCKWKPRAKPQHGCSQHGSRGPVADLQTVPQPCPPRPTNNFLMLHWALFLFFFPFHEVALLLIFPWSVPFFLALKALCKLQGRFIAMSSSSSTVQIPCGCTGRSCPAHLPWATGPLTEYYPYISKKQ